MIGATTNSRMAHTTSHATGGRQRGVAGLWQVVARSSPGGAGRTGIVRPVSAPSDRPADRPPSVDALARSLQATGLPHPLLVDVAQQAIAAHDWDGAEARASALARTLLQPVINAT